jgi:uncharacterized membrane protein HdeD (DUF308 family)
VRRELAPPPTVEVPDLAGQKVSQARSRLASKGLKLSAHKEVVSDTIAEGEVIKQSPEPGTEVVAGSPVSITVSSGPHKVIATAPPGDQTGEHTNRIERAQPLLPASAGSRWALVLRGLVMGMFGLVLLLTSIEPGSGQFRLYSTILIIADGVFATIDAKTRVGRRRLLLIQGRISGLVGLFILLVWLVQDTPIVSDVNESVKTSLVDLIQPWAIAASLVGSWAIFIGAIRIIAAIQLRWETKNLLLMGTSGVLLVISGILLWLPSFNSWRLLGFLALASGITLIAVALRVRDPEEWDSRVRYRRV